MGIKQDILAVLRGRQPERIPWTIYASQLFRGRAERALRNRGLGILKGCPVCATRTPNVDVETRTFWENGRQLARRTYHTPAGTVSEKVVIAPGYYSEGVVGEWIVEYMIKDVADYEAVRFIVEDTVREPDHDGFARAQARFGDDGLLLANMERCPIQHLSIKLAGLERVALDLHDHPGVVEGLLEAMERKQDETYRIGVDSPAEIIWSPDNISTSRTSPRWFERYVLPFYERHAAMVRDAGKLYVAHMDGRLAAIKHLIARCPLDVIEAVTPPPMGDTPITELQDAWPGKAVWCNFPESLFHEDESVIYEAALDLMRNAYSRGRFILGITEDYPEHRMEPALSAIARAVADYEGA
ncbi:MAG: hypothetical protein FJ313_05195 [Gemmatimonadetes bacterium]|nr:hypothetical protein [Gemmatimonadota bacterium]